MKLENLDISQLIPLFMRNEGDARALAESVSDILQPLAQQVARLSTWGQLQKLTEEQLDALAEELNIFWYDHATLSLDQKRLVIANSDLVYMHLGTKMAVQNVVSEIFSDEAIVEEWFEYNGLPHYFRIQVADSRDMTPEKEAQLLRIINYVKRKSQWLEAIQNKIALTMPLFIGMSIGVHAVNRITIDVWQDHPSADYYAGPSALIRQEGSESGEISLVS